MRRTQYVTGYVRKSALMLIMLSTQGVHDMSFWYRDERGREGGKGRGREGAWTGRGRENGPWFSVSKRVQYR